MPWLELARAPSKYLGTSTIPEGFNVLDPSRLTKDMVRALWCHWSGRARADLPILVFTKARKQDLGKHANVIPRPVVGKRVAYVEVGSEEEADDNEPERSPPSKRPRLSKEIAIPDKQSPAANNGGRTEFLRHLVGDPVLWILLRKVQALPGVVSSFPPSLVNICLTIYCKVPHESSLSATESMLCLPIWASWDWGQKYLPEKIHADKLEFSKELDLLHKYKFADCDKGTIVVLGFGLLLRDCWRALESENDDESSPKFLRDSHLGSTEVIDQVVKAIGEVVDGLSLPKEKELGGQIEGQKAKASQKSRGKLPTRTHTPPPVASTSKKPSDAQKEDTSPSRNGRSQRQRKPSKKVLDST